MRIGKIFVPGTEDEKPGSVQLGKESHLLGTGQTAIITTLEKISLGRRVAAIGFPPSRVASRGLMMLNPGHVDPGYSGRMKFTVINMGKNSYTLQKGAVIFTALFSKVGEVEADFAVRNPTHGGGVPEAEELDRLTRDFIDFDRRVDERISKADRLLKWLGVVVPVAAAAITVIGTQIVGWIQVSDLKTRVEKTESILRAKELESLSARVERLEKSTAGPTSAATTTPTPSSSPALKNHP